MTAIATRLPDQRLVVAGILGIALAAIALLEWVPGPVLVAGALICGIASGGVVLDRFEITLPGLTASFTPRTRNGGAPPWEPTSERLRSLAELVCLDTRAGQVIAEAVLADLRLGGRRLRGAALARYAIERVLVRESTGRVGPRLARALSRLPAGADGGAPQPLPDADVVAVLARLAPIVRAAVALHFCWNVSTTETAALVGMDAGELRPLLQRTRTELEGAP